MLRDRSIFRVEMGRRIKNFGAKQSEKAEVHSKKLKKKVQNLGDIKDFFCQNYQISDFSKKNQIFPPKNQIFWAFFKRKKCILRK